MRQGTLSVTGFHRERAPRDRGAEHGMRCRGNLRRWSVVGQGATATIKTRVARDVDVDAGGRPPGRRSRPGRSLPFRTTCAGRPTTPGVAGAHVHYAARRGSRPVAVTGGTGLELKWTKPPSPWTDRATRSTWRTVPGRCAIMPRSRRSASQVRGHCPACAKPVLLTGCDRPRWWAGSTLVVTPLDGVAEAEVQRGL